MKIYSVVFILAFLAVGCTEQGKPVHEHERALPSDTGRAGTETSPATEPTPEVQAMQLTAENSADPVNEVLIPLGAKVLDLKRVGDVSMRVSRVAMDELEAFNRLFLKYAAQMPGDARLKKLLTDYATALEYRCDLIASSCDGIRYFKISASSSDVAKLVIKAQPDKHYRFTYIALALSNRNWDGELANLLLIRAADLRNQVEERFFRAAVTQLETAFSLVAKRSLSNDEFKNFLSDIRIWEVLESPQLAVSAATRETAFALIARSGFMYGTDGAMTPEFRRVVEAQASSERGLYAIQNRLRAMPFFHPEAVGAKFETQKDEIFFALDAVATGGISSQAGSLLLLGSKASVEDITARIQNYTRLAFSEAVLDATQKAKQLFDTPMPIGERLDVTLRRSSNIKSVWVELASVLRPLESLAEIQISQRALARGSDQESALKEIFRGLGKTINMAAVYPHSLLFYYQLELKGFKTRISSADGNYSRDYDGSTLISDLMNGDPLFLMKHGENEDALTAFEILHGMDMAMRLGVFEVLGINPGDFIAKFVAGLTKNDIRQVETFTNNIRDRFTSQTGTLFTQACAEFREGGKSLIPRRFMFWEAKTSPYFGPLLSSSAQTMTASSIQYSPDSKRNYFASVDGSMFYPEYQYAESLEKTRTELSNSLRWTEILLTSYRSYLSHTLKLSEADVQARMKKAEAEAARVKEKRRQVVRRGVELFQTYGRCYYAMEIRDSEIKQKLIQASMAYFRQVYSDVQKLRASTQPSITELQQIVARHTFTGLPSDYRGQSQISAEGYNLNMVDMYIRFAQFMQSGLKTERETIEPIAPHVLYDLGLKMDKDVKFMSEGRMRPIYYSKNESTFVANALRAMMESGQISWFEPNTRNTAIENWRVMLESIITLYKLDRVVNGDNATMKGQDIIDLQQLAADIFKRDPSKRALFNLVGLEYDLKYTASGVEGLFFTLARPSDVVAIQRAMGIFDMPGVLMNREVLGYDYDVQFWSLEPGKRAEVTPRTGYLKVALNYHHARAVTSRTPTILPFSPALDTAMDKMMRDWIGAETKAVRDYHNSALAYLTEIVKLPAELRPRVDITNAISISSPLLNDHVINDFNKTMTDFEAATNGCFASATCRDFQ